MNKNEKFVITINRELGSGGRTVGCKLAEKLGVPFFDKALITELEKKFHLTLEEIEDLKSQKHSWWADFKRQMSLGEDAVRYYQVEMGKEPEELTTFALFKSEEEIYNNLAEQESCVVAGRTGFYAFRNHPNHLNIFIQAPMSFRVACASGASLKTRPGRPSRRWTKCVKTTLRNTRTPHATTPVTTISSSIPTARPKMSL